MARGIGVPLVAAALMACAACKSRQAQPAAIDRALADRIWHLADVFLTSDDEQLETEALSDATAIFEHDGVPTNELLVRQHSPDLCG